MQRRDLRPFYVFDIFDENRKHRSLDTIIYQIDNHKKTTDRFLSISDITQFISIDYDLL